MKTKLFTIPLALIFLVALVSAGSVVTFLLYDSTTSDSLTITNGDQFGFAVTADSLLEDSMELSVDLLTSDGTLVNNLLETYTTEDSYSNHLTVGIEAYVGVGNYIIVSTLTAAGGDTDMTQLSLTVEPVPDPNNAPVITSTAITQITEGGDYSYQVTATDADGDTLTYSLTQNPTWLSIDADTGLVSGTAPFIDVDEVFAVTVTVSDGEDSTIQFYSLTVNNVVLINGPPVFTSSPVTQVDENQDYSYVVIADDPEGIWLEYNLIQAPSWLNIDPNYLVVDNNRALLYGTAPAVSVDTDFDVTVEVSDGFNTVSQSYVLTVANVLVINNAPVITSTAVTQVDENQAYSYQVTATDADGDTLTYSFTTAPSWLSVDTNTGLISGTAPTVSSDTDFDVTVQVSDGADVTSQTYVLTVINAFVSNNAPVITSTAVTQVDENQAYSYQVTATDADGDTLTYSLTTTPSWLSVDADTGFVTGTAPVVSVNTDFEVTIDVSDGTDITSQSYVLTVANVLVINNAPVITSTAVTSVDENQVYSYQVVATDADGDTLTYSLTAAPAWLSIDSSTGLITGISPVVSVDEDYLIMVSASDGIDSTSQIYTLTVENTPSAPKKSRVKTVVDEFYEEEYTKQRSGGSASTIDLGESEVPKQVEKSSSKGMVLLSIIILVDILAILIILSLLII